MARLLRTFAISAFACGAFAFAQPATVDELVHALRTDALVTEEPLGAIIDCAPYAEVFPDAPLTCFELYLPDRVVRGRFQAYVGDVEAFTWVEEDWVRISDLPSHVDPEDNHIRRTIASTSGDAFTISVFDQGITSHIVVVMNGD